MATNITIRKYQVDALNTLIELLSVKQIELSQQSGYPASSLSSLLNLKKNNDFIKIWDESFASLVDTISAMFYERSKELKANKKYTEAHKLLVCLKNGIPPGEYKITNPTGPLKADSTNYVERAEDANLFNILETEDAPSTVIMGGVQCGKTSLLKRFSETARSKGYKVIEVDFKDTILAEKLQLTLSDLYIYVIRAAINELGDEGKSEQDLEKDIQRRKSAQPGDWARDYLGSLLEDNYSSSRVLLVIDSLDHLFTRFEKGDVINTFIFWLGGIRNFMDKKPFDKLNIVAVDSFLTFGLHSTIHASPVLKTQSKLITIPSFNKNEIRELSRLMGIERETERIINDLFNLFAGHPVLTHNALYEMYTGKDFAEIRLNALRQMGHYGSYWRNLKRHLELLLKFTGNVGKLGAVFTTILSENYHAPIYQATVVKLYEQWVLAGVLSTELKIISEFVKTSMENETR